MKKLLSFIIAFSVLLLQISCVYAGADPADRSTTVNPVLPQTNVQETLTLDDIAYSLNEKCSLVSSVLDGMSFYVNNQEIQLKLVNSSHEIKGTFPVGNHRNQYYYLETQMSGESLQKQYMIMEKMGDLAVVPMGSNAAGDITVTYMFHDGNGKLKQAYAYNVSKAWESKFTNIKIKCGKVIATNAQGKEYQIIVDSKTGETAVPVDGVGEKIILHPCSKVTLVDRVHGARWLKGIYPRLFNVNGTGQVVDIEKSIQSIQARDDAPGIAKILLITVYVKDLAVRNVSAKEIQKFSFISTDGFKTSEISAKTRKYGDGVFMICVNSLRGDIVIATGPDAKEYAIEMQTDGTYTATLAEQKKPRSHYSQFPIGENIDPRFEKKFKGYTFFNEKTAKEHQAKVDTIEETEKTIPTAPSVGTKVAVFILWPIAGIFDIVIKSVFKSGLSELLWGHDKTRASTPGYLIAGFFAMITMPFNLISFGLLEPYDIYKGIFKA